MVAESLADALEREHREIDDGIEAFVAAPSTDAGRGALARAIAALRRHIYLEEEFVFPALRDEGGVALVAPIFVMLREHAQIWHELEALEADIAGPETLHRCHQLLIRLQHHNLKEERVLYPETDRALPPASVARLAGFLASGRLPNSWACISARDGG